MPAIVLLVSYFLLQTTLILTLSNGPFTDEAIYITAGRHILENLSSNPSVWHTSYSFWFQGSPHAWPILAAFAYQYGGLFGARILAVALSTVALAALYAAWKLLFDKKTAFWSVGLLALNGHFIFIGQLAVYDILGLALASLGFLCVSTFVEKKDNTWLLIFAGLAIAAAAISKYGYLLALVPVVGLLFSRMPFRKAALATSIITGTFALVFLGYWFLVFGKLSLAVTKYYTSQDVKPRSELLLQFACWLAVPLAVAGVGGKRIARGHAGAILYCFPLLILVVSSHVATQAHVSANKHIALGLAFFYPLVAIGFIQLSTRLSARTRLTFLLLITVAGIAQWYQMSRTWPDSRPVSKFLVSNMKAGDRLAAEDGWVYRLPLYWQGVVKTTDRVLDSWKLDRARGDLCKLDWLVGRIQDGEEDRVVKLARSCGFKPVFSHESKYVTGIESGAPRRFPVILSIFRK
jgi:4-amino-4-deoxy-L-arabinose transferase-like glycosyltransferase